MSTLSIDNFNPRGKKYYMKDSNNDFCYESVNGVCSLYLSESEVIQDNQSSYLPKCNANYCRNLYKEFIENGVQDTIEIILNDCNHYLVTRGQHMLCSAAKNGSKLEVELKKQDEVCNICSKEKDIEKAMEIIQTWENKVENSNLIFKTLLKLRDKGIVNNGKKNINEYELRKSSMHRDFSSTILKKSEKKLLEEYRIILGFINNVEKDFYKEFNEKIEFELYSDERGYSAYIPCTGIFKDLGFSIRMNLNILYEDRINLLKKYERENCTDYMTDKELSENLKEIQKLKYVKIDALYITPRGTGVGSKVVNILVNRLKEIKSIEYILLYPADEKAKKFWSKQGFGRNKDKKYDGKSFSDLVLEL